jgi:folate-binding protein YgfZ
MDVWVPREAGPAIDALTGDFDSISREAYNIARLEAGIPLYGADMNARTLPPEMGAQFEARHISYKKGCYTGQEVLMRIHSRGHTNRTWVGLLSDDPLEIGAPIAHSLRADAGTVTSSVFSPDYGYLGAAMVRNELAFDGEMVKVRTERGDVEAEVRRMPILRLD